MADRVASSIILGNESIDRTDAIQWHLSFHHGFFQEQVDVPVFYIGETDEVGDSLRFHSTSGRRCAPPLDHNAEGRAIVDWSLA